MWFRSAVWGECRSIVTMSRSELRDPTAVLPFSSYTTRAWQRSSFDPLFEGCQQPLCPNPRFDPAPAVQGLSGTSSLCRHCDRLFFSRSGHCVSTFLHPFAPPALPGFYARMGALTPGRPALRLFEHEHRLCYRPGLPAFCHRTFGSFRLQPSTVVPTRHWGFVRRSYRTTLLWPPVRGHASVGLRQFLAGSPRRSAESSSLALRTDRSPPVALHPASRRRSYLWLRSARTPRQGLSPC
jgi:hypothetical protein